MKHQQVLIFESIDKLQDKRAEIMHQYVKNENILLYDYNQLDYHYIYNFATIETFLSDFIKKTKSSIAFNTKHLTRSKQVSDFFKDIDKKYASLNTIIIYCFDSKNNDDILFTKMLDASECRILRIDVNESNITDKIFSFVNLCKRWDDFATLMNNKINKKSFFKNNTNIIIDNIVDVNIKSIDYYNSRVLSTLNKLNCFEHELSILPLKQCDKETIKFNVDIIISELKILSPKNVVVFSNKIEKFCKEHLKYCDIINLGATQESIGR